MLDITFIILTKTLSLRNSLCMPFVSSFLKNQRDENIKLISALNDMPWHLPSNAYWKPNLELINYCIKVGLKKFNGFLTAGFEFKFIAK
jgi:hypothetical protein